MGTQDLKDTQELKRTLDLKGTQGLKGSQDLKGTLGGLKGTQDLKGQCDSGVVNGGKMGKMILMLQVQTDFLTYHFRNHGKKSHRRKIILMY